MGLLGLVVGFLWRKLIDQRGGGMILDIVLGILGACIGGDLFSILGPHGTAGMNLYGLLVAGIGSMIFLTAYNAIGRGQQRRRSGDRSVNGDSRKENRPRGGDLPYRNLPSERREYSAQ
jgi:uncharacterized membrane protein YeaQ/YmgE (transglycosylase-associated protein family)